MDTNDATQFQPADSTARRGTEVDVPLEWNIGDVILGTYEVTGILGEGGMGKVYKVHHRGWNVDLAVKSPKPEIFAKAGGQENFVREAETWVNLGLHPHTVSCYYVRTLGGIPRVFAEYVAGGSLADWIREYKLHEGGPDKALERMLDIAIQFAWGLHYAHEQGLVHQDVKPANVMMTLDGTVKVTDFGLAKARAMAGEMVVPGEGQSILVSTGGMTPAYCSPEQAAGQPLSRKTDIWSWGLSVLEMFVGEVTWAAGQVAAEALISYSKIGSEDPAIPAMPAALAALLELCFRRNPADRPASMEEVAAELQEIYQQGVGRSYPFQVPKPVEALADSLNNRAISLLDLRHKEKEAERLWDEALKLLPYHLETTYNRGLILWRSGRITDNALVRQLEEVQVSRQEDWLSTYLLGLVHIERGDYETALKVLRSITEAEADREEVRETLSLAIEHLPRSRGLLRTFEGQGFGEGLTSPNSVCLSRDGRYALSDLYDTLKLWEVATGRCLRTFKGHKEKVTSVCLSQDGRYALSGSWDKTLKLWEVATGRCLRTFIGHSYYVYAVCLSQDGRYALSGSGDTTLKLWEVTTCRCLRTFKGHEHAVFTVCLSQDTRLVLSGSYDNTVKLWDAATGHCLRTFKGHKRWVTSVCLSQDGQHALSGSYDNTIKLWDAATGRCLRTLEGHTNFVQSVCLSHDERYILSGGSDRALMLWEVATGRCLRTFQEPTGTMHSVCLSHDGKYALSGSGDQALKLWKINCAIDPYPAPMRLAQVQMSEIALSAEMTYKRNMVRAQESLAQGDIVTAAHHIREARSQRGYSRHPEALDAWSRLYVRLPHASFRGGWEGATFEGHDGRVNAACLSEDGQLVLSGGEDHTLKLWEMPTGRCLRTLKGHTQGVGPVFLSQDGHYALSGSRDKTYKLWEVATGRCLRTFEGHGVRCLSQDWRYALSGGGWKDTTLKLWEVATGRYLRTFIGHTLPVQRVCLSQDNRYALSGSQDHTLKLWEVATGRCLRTFTGHMHYVTAVCLSRDGRYALSGSGDRDRTLKLWEVATGRCLRTLKGHAEHTYVTSLCLSHDGRYALSATSTAFGKEDATFKLWDLATARCLRTFEGHARSLTSLCLSRDGRYVLSGSIDGTLKLWILDWELADKEPADWDEGARPYLEIFLTQRTPYAAPLPQGHQPIEEEITLALTRRGKPTWAEKDFEQLLYTLGCAGYGWLQPKGVRQELKRMAREWEGPLPLIAD